MEQRDTVCLNGGGCVVQICLGEALEEQDVGGGHPGHGNHFETAQAHNAKIADFLLFSMHSDTKAAMAEWFNCTLKEELYQYLTAKNIWTYLQVLQSIMQE